VTAFFRSYTENIQGQPEKHRLSKFKEVLIPISVKYKNVLMILPVDCLKEYLIFC